MESKGKQTKEKQRNKIERKGREMIAKERNPM